MGRFLIKLTDDKSKKSWYLEWSTIVDAPVTKGMSLRELEDHIQYWYGREGMRELPQRLERVEERGHSIMSNQTLKQLISVNRAGAGETNLSIKRIIKEYCN